MKELTIEQKVKAYDEAKLRMSRAFNSNRCTIGFMNEIFPELVESEDEKIRRELLAHCKDKAEKYSNDPKYKNINAWIAWLEKQDNKSTNIDIESMVSSYKQRLKNQGAMENSPLLNMCLSAFRHGIENVLDELNLKQGKSNPYSGISFEYNGHTFGMCARDDGTEILIDSNLKVFISPDASFIYPDISTPNDIDDDDTVRVVGSL